VNIEGTTVTFYVIFDQMYLLMEATCRVKSSEGPFSSKSCIFSAAIWNVQFPYSKRVCCLIREGN
jgi:hypothetical protein